MKLWKLYWGDTGIRNDALFATNVLKGLNVIATESSEKALEVFKEVVTIEMLNDRFFDMYFYENDLKLGIYQKMAKKVLGERYRENSIDISFVLEFEEARRGGTFKEKFCKEFERFTKDRDIDDLVEKLQKELQSAEKRHVYKRDLHILPLKDWERETYKEVLNFLKKFDKDGEIMFFDDYHREHSAAYKLAVVEYKLSLAHCGVEMRDMPDVDAESTDTNLDFLKTDTSKGGEDKLAFLDDTASSDSGIEGEKNDEASAASH